MNKTIKILLSLFLMIFGMLCNNSKLQAEVILPNYFIYEVSVAAFCYEGKVIQYKFATITTNRRITQTCQYKSAVVDTEFKHYYIFLDEAGYLYFPYKNGTYSNEYITTTTSGEICFDGGYEKTSCYENSNVLVNK